MHLSKIRWEILYTVNYTAQKPNFALLKRIIRYLVATVNHGYTLKRFHGTPVLVGMCDAEFGRNQDSQNTGGRKTLVGMCCGSIREFIKIVSICLMITLIFGMDQCL